MLDGIDVDYALRNLDRMPPGEQARILELLEENERLEKLFGGRTHFLDFVKAVWPAFIPGPHHAIVAEAFDRIIDGDLTRLILNMPPRHTKSEFASVLLPACYLGRFPDRKVIQTSNTESLAAGFGRRVRNLIDGEGEKNAAGASPYQQLFPGVELAKDSQAAAGWHTNKGGRYFAIGVNGRVTGEGANLLIIDDPHDEQQAKQAETSPEIFDSVYDWYTSGPRQRLQPGGAIVVVMTRWSKRDLTGQVIKKMQEEANNRFTDKWEVIEFPAILDENAVNENGASMERPVWPGWNLMTPGSPPTLDWLRSTRSVLPVAKWQAQFQQRPTSEEGAILKREYWKEWGVEGKPAPTSALAAPWNDNEPPPCDYVIQSWDCAATKNDRSNYSACTTWGVFKTEDPDGRGINNAILLSAWRRRMEFPELKRTVKRFYDEELPDSLLIENKSAGIQLIQELRRMGVPVSSGNDSSRGGGRGMSNDKVARANGVADIFASGYVWATRARWAQEVIEECAEFPNGEYDDYVDTVVQALMRFRQGGFIGTVNDEREEEVPYVARKRMY